MPSNERLPCEPPPPKPAASPTQYKPETAWLLFPKTLQFKSVRKPPKLLRVVNYARMAIKGPEPDFCSGAGLQVRNLSGPHWRACNIRRI